MDYILLGTIIGFTALTVLLWRNLCVQTTRAETYRGDLNAFRYLIDCPDSAFVPLPLKSELDAVLIQAAREVGKAKKAARSAQEPVLDRMEADLDRIEARINAGIAHLEQVIAEDGGATAAPRGFTKIKDILLEPGPVGDPIKLHLIDEHDNTVTVAVLTEGQFKGISDHLIAASKKPRRGALS